MISMNSQKSQLKRKFRDFLDTKKETTKKDKEASYKRRTYHEIRKKLEAFHKNAKLCKINSHLIDHVIKNYGKIIVKGVPSTVLVNDPLFGTFYHYFGFYNNDVGYDQIYTVKTLRYSKIAERMYKITEKNKLEQVDGSIWKVWIPLEGSND